MSKRSHWKQRLQRRVAPALLLVFAAGALPAACKSGDVGKSSPDQASSAVAAESAGPCEAYAARLCEQAGAESQTCAAVKSTTDLLPPAACAAGLEEVDFSLKRLEAKRGKCDELTQKLCTELGKETETCTMVTTQTQQFPPERCEMMLEHYDEVLADLKKHEEANKPLSAEQQAAIAGGSAPSFGPKDAKVTLVEFSDFQCPYCSRAADVVHKVREKYGDQVRFVFRQFPLSFHTEAHAAAQASLAAHEQGKFWDFHDRLFANPQKLDRESLEQHAKESGLDLAAFRKALDDEKFAGTVDAELKMGQEVAVQGTPTLFVNGARVANPTDFELVSSLIDAALKG